MVSKVFRKKEGNRGKLVPPANTTNDAGGAAYKLEDRAAIAQMAVTGTFGGAFYVNADEQLKRIGELIPKVDSEFLAKCAVYARKSGFMKDMPAYMLAQLTARAAKDADAQSWLERAFPLVCDNAKMVRNYVAIVRSGETGRKSLGSQPKRLVAEWLRSKSPEAILRGNVGNDPSLADVVKMARPRPKTAAQRAIFGLICGSKPASGQELLRETSIVEKRGKKVAHVTNRFNYDDLPQLAKHYEIFKRNMALEESKREAMALPDVPFEMLTAFPLSAAQWKTLAEQSSYIQSFMNLMTFGRHGVFDDAGVVAKIAAKLRSREAISEAKVFPYKLMMAHSMVAATAPREITEALQDAMEIATENVPTFEGKGFVCVDCSGSMGQPITGVREATTKVSVNQVASLFAAAVVRKNPSAELIRFDSVANVLRVNPRDSVMTLASQISTKGGATDCSAALRTIRNNFSKVDWVVFLSDYESWLDTGYRGTGSMAEWELIRASNPDAKIACINLVPNTTSQMVEREDILNIGGFSDRVFDVVKLHLDLGMDKKLFTEIIGKTVL